MTRYLSRTEAAARIGVAAPTLSRYRLPEPDAMVGRARGWLPATIDRWHAARPGSPGRSRDRVQYASGDPVAIERCQFFESPDLG